jgi:hypothetical protein
MKCPEPGIYKDVPNAVYHGPEYQDAVNNSLLKTVRSETPAQAYYDQTHPKPQTEAMGVGEAVHLALLEPHLFDENVVRGLGVDRRSKKNQQAHALHELENADKLILKHGDYDRVKGMADAGLHHGRSAELLASPGLNEVTIVGDMEAEGMMVRCRIRPDRLTRFQKWNAIVDVKSIEGSLSLENINRACGNFAYDMQAAFYLDVAEALAPADRRFFFVFVSKRPPYLRRVVEAGAEMIFNGRTKYRWALNDWAKCLKSGEYPGWTNDIDIASLNKFATVSDAEHERHYEEE